MHPNGNFASLPIQIIRLRLCVIITSMMVPTLFYRAPVLSTM
jgi:hypothetical protein